MKYSDIQFLYLTIYIYSCPYICTIYYMWCLYSLSYFIYFSCQCTGITTWFNTITSFSRVFFYPGLCPYSSVCVCGPVSGVPGIPRLYDKLTYRYGRIFIFNSQIPTPRSGILITIILHVPSFMSNNEHKCNCAGYKIIHAYV